jgi:Lamin Tail Domain
MSRLSLLLLLLVLLAVPNPAGAASPDIVVSQVYGGGGNSGAPFQNDFVELFNRGSTAMDVSGWTVQYATASSGSWSQTTLAGTIAPGGYYLVQEGSGGTSGSSLPTADAVGTLNLSSTNGKIALVRGSTALTCGTSPGSCASDASIADLVGYGSASDYEGSAAAPSLSSTTAAVRAGNGCTDTDDNGSDFSATAPSPKNSASPANDCGGPPPPPPSGSASADASVTADVASALSVSLSRTSIDFGRLAYGSPVPSIGEDVTIASNDPSGYMLSVHRTAFTPDDLPLALSAQAPAGGELNPGLAGSVKVAIPVAPAPDLLIGSSSSISEPAGDVWPTEVGFLEPLPLVRAGMHSATVTYTVIGR